MDTTIDNEKKKKLTLDKVLGAEAPEAGKPRVHAYPPACKNCQHCNSVITRNGK